MINYCCVGKKTIGRCIRSSIEISAKKGVWIRCRHFTFILDGQRIIARGINSRKTHPANLTYAYVGRNMEPISEFVGTHSEMNAVLEVGLENCRGLSLLNIRVDRNGNIRQSKPCKGCMDMIKKAGFAEVLHTDDHGCVVRLTGAETPFGVTRHQTTRF